MRQQLPGAGLGGPRSPGLHAEGGWQCACFTCHPPPALPPLRGAIPQVRRAHAQSSTQRGLRAASRCWPDARLIW